MNKLDKIKINKLIHTIGLEYNLSDDKIKQIVESQFEFTTEKLRKIDFSTLKTDEDIENLKSTFLYKSFGKLYINPLSLSNYIKRRDGRSKKCDNGKSEGTN